MVPTTLLAQWQVEISKSLTDPDTLPVYVYVDIDLLDGGGDYVRTGHHKARMRTKAGMFAFLEDSDGGIVLTTYSMLMKKGNACFVLACLTLTLTP